MGRTHTHAHFHRPFEDQCFHEWDGKLALAQDKAPSRGELGEPRRFYTGQRAPSPKLGGTDNKTNTKKNTEKSTLEEVYETKGRLREEEGKIGTTTEMTTGECIGNARAKPPGETG